MATVLAKTHIIPFIAVVRATCARTQHITDMKVCTNVIVNSSLIAYTCHEAGGNHIYAVAHRRTQNTAKNAHHGAEESFDLSCGDDIV